MEKLILDEIIDDTPQELERQAVERERARLQYNQNDFDQLKEQTLLDGQTAGRQEALQSIEKATQDLLGTVTNHLQQIKEQDSKRETDLTIETANFTLSLLEKIFPVLDDLIGKQSVAELIKKHIEQNSNASHIKALVHPDVADFLNEKIKSHEIDPTYFQITADPAIKNISDCKIDWHSAALDKNFETFMQEIDAMIDTLRQSGSKTDTKQEKDQ